MGEIDALSMAADGRVFYAGRAVCFQGQQQFTNWTHPTTGLGCGPIYVFDPRGEGSQDQNPARITKVADFTVFGAKGGGSETGATAKTEQGILGIALDPQFGVPGATATSSTSPTTRTTAARWAATAGPAWARASSAPTTWPSVVCLASPTTRPPRRSRPAPSGSSTAT